MTGKAGRRPADAPTPGRQDIWTAIRARPDRFTAAELVADTGANLKTAQDYLRCLLPAGIIEALDEGAFRLIDDRGFHAPRVNRQGRPVTAGAGVETMWWSMQGLSQFTPRDLAAHSTTPDVRVTEVTAKSYCAMLLKTGYLRVIQKASPVHGRQAIYRLIRNSGPRPPQIQRIKQVYETQHPAGLSARRWRMSGPVAKARAAWGKDGKAIPDWIMGLARECETTSQNKVAARMNRSASLVSAVLGGTYKGSLEAVEEVYRGVFEKAVVACTALGTIPANDCRDWQLKAQRFLNINSERVRMYRACNACPRFKGSKADD